MAHHNRFVDSVVLSLAAASLAVTGCGAGDGNTQAGNPSANASGGSSGAGPVVPAPSAGGSTGLPPGAGSSVNVPPGTGAAGMPAPGAGGAVILPPGSGGSPIVAPGTGGSAGAAPGGGGSAGAPSTGGNGNGTVNGTPTDTWNVMSNLDASGVMIPPATGKGFQITTTTFDLQPGQEIFNCYHSTFPNTAEFDVGDWESQMSKGSHHFILYSADSDTVASNTLVNGACTNSFGGPQWLYSAAVPHTHLSMPDGVAMPLAANKKVVFDMHYINLGTDLIHAHVSLNVNQVKSTEFQKAESQVSFNLNISIPPNGKQTVGGDCTPPAGAKYFMMLTHTHRRGIDASITRKLANGQLGETLVHTTNWDSPENYLWENPPYLTFQAGEKFHYKCSYMNDRSSTTTVGISAANNEMCMAITYFFPATGNLSTCTSDVE